MRRLEASIRIGSHWKPSQHKLYGGASLKLKLEHPDARCDERRRCEWQKHERRTSLSKGRLVFNDLHRIWLTCELQRWFDKLQSAALVRCIAARLGVGATAKSVPPIPTPAARQIPSAEDRVELGTDSDTRLRPPPLPTILPSRLTTTLRRPHAFQISCIYSFSKHPR